MAYLSLQGIGKIYVSGQNVAVGIRGVDLDFEIGEFVAVTGKSGSGKSTLLNVISGMDSYEEGELYIEGAATSHYMQSDWEAFREKYISFIFQDYNIIESFTVLENVELALMHIEDVKKRRERALALLERVGLSSHLKHKGSRLSGGQKQRVVIARALAKDSPILLADEPTGNLDSESAKEIVKLLYEISEEKLVIVVTHNFDQLEGYATRHIRIFDGAIEKDFVMSPKRCDTPPERVLPRSDTQGPKKDLKNGLLLGKSIFFSRPKLSIFLCCLMVLGTLALFMITGFCGDAFSVFEPHYMFTPSEGRMILTRQNGAVLTEEELKKLVQDYGAERYLRYDMLLDETAEIVIPTEDWDEWLSASVFSDKQYKGEIIGRYPTRPGEVLLRLPLSYQTVMGKDTIEKPYIMLDGTLWEVVGLSYEIDNNMTPEVVVSEEGYRYAQILHYLRTKISSLTGYLKIADSEGNEFQYYMEFVPTFALEHERLYAADLPTLLKEFGTVSDYSAVIEVNQQDWDINTDSIISHYFSDEFASDLFTDQKPQIPEGVSHYVPIGKGTVSIHPALLLTLVEDYLKESYRQASLFFESDVRAEEVAMTLLDKGYRAVTSRETYSPSAAEVILEVIGAMMELLLWFGYVIFLSFFISLCSSRALAAFKGDMAIMRSMGISVKVIRIAMYVRMLIALIPGFFTTVITAVLIYTNPTANGIFRYLYAWQYGLIFLGMLILVGYVTRKQIKRLFSESVKKSLKGGDTV